MEACRSAFLVVKTFQVLYESFSNRLPQGTAIYSLPQEGIKPDAVAKKYRGLDREPLSGWSLESMARLLRTNPTAVPIPERAAILAMAALENDGRAKDDLLLFLQDARDVYLTLGEPNDWEILWVRLGDASVDPPAQTALLGFEPTWFPEGDFSPVCDCMCFPRYHGTDRKGTLFADHYARLNGHGLFDSPSDAADFLRFYRSFDWTEGGEYSIVGVYALADAVYEHLRTPVRYAVIDAADRKGSLTDILGGMTWDVHLRGLPKDCEIRGIKALMDITGMGLAAAKGLVEALPKTLAVVHIGEVELLKHKLLKAGFELQIAARA